MIEFRCFRNDDPPRLADVWRSADLGPAAMQPMTSALLEVAVFSKPYFDSQGLIVALDINEMDPIAGAHILKLDVFDDAQAVGVTTSRRRL